MASGSVPALPPWSPYNKTNQASYPPLEYHSIYLGLHTISIGLPFRSPGKRLASCYRDLRGNLSVLNVKHLLSPLIQGVGQTLDLSVGVVVVEHTTDAWRTLGHDREVNGVSTVLGHLEMEDQEEVLVRTRPDRYNLGHERPGLKPIGKWDTQNSSLRSPLVGRVCLNGLEEELNKVLDPFLSLVRAYKRQPSASRMLLGSTPYLDSLVRLEQVVTSTNACQHKETRGSGVDDSTCKVDEHGLDSRV